MSTRIGLTVSDEMDELLEKLAEAMRKPKSEIVREAIEGYLKDNGMVVNERLQWGGSRWQKDG